MNIPCIDWAVVFSYMTAMITCGSLAAADLIGRFQSGNSILSILWGGPQRIFFSLSIGAGVLALFGSEVLGYTKIFVTGQSDLKLAIVQTSLFSAVTYVGLRTTISNGEKIEIGPGLIFIALLENIERRIDQERTVVALDEIRSIRSISPRGVMNVVLPYCFDQAEKETGDREQITTTLEAIYKTSNVGILESERSALMLSHLHKVFGIAVLKAAARLVEAGDEPILENRNGETAHSELELVTDELDSWISKLRSKK